LQTLASSSSLSEASGVSKPDSSILFVMLVMKVKFLNKSADRVVLVL
jgi:hypothetical protein